MAVASLPPGFRFHPTDIELIMYYLKRKVMGKKLQVEAISELNIYLFSPEDLPDKSCLKSKDLEWYFFCPREKKYASGTRMNRATETGFWKTTGKDRTISYNDRVVGMVKTLIFHEGNAPHGNRTDWVLHEYRLEDKSLADSGVVQDTFVLCKIFKKNGLGPKNGAQYGAPYKEEEWDNDFNVDVSPTFPSDAISPLMDTLPENQNTFLENGVAPAPSGKGYKPLMVETAQSQVQFSDNNWHGDCQNNVRVPGMVDPGNAFGSSLADVDPWIAFGSSLADADPRIAFGLSLADVDPCNAFGPSLADVDPIQFVDEADHIIARMLAEFTDDDALPSNDIRNIQNLGSDTASQLTESDPFNASGRGIDAPASQLSFDQSSFLLQNGVPFIEYADLDASYVSSLEFSGPEQSKFTGMLNSENGFDNGIGQPFGYGASSGSNSSYLILNEHAPLPNSFSELFDPRISLQTMIGFGNNFSEGAGSREPLYHATNSQPRNVGGEEEIKESDNSKFFR